MLVLQVVLLHVAIHTLGHLRAAHQSALGLAEEQAQLIRHLGGALEDAGLAGLRIRTLHHRRPALALAPRLHCVPHTPCRLCRTKREFDGPTTVGD